MTAPEVSPVKTTCPYCGVGCGVEARLEQDDPLAPRVSIAGDAEHPANFGRLCVKGSALGETLSREDRLLQPMIEGQAVDWDQALNHVADGIRHALQTYGPESVAFYVSGQLLTEDYYVANKLMKGVIGTANIDTNSRLCMSSTVVGHKRAFGTDTVPGCYEDLELADLIIMVGSNMAWCHPVLFQRISAARAKNPKLRLILIDPRRTATADESNQFLPLNSGSDAFLFNGLLNFLRHNDYLDFDYLEQNCQGFGKALQEAESATIPVVAQATGLAESELVSFYRDFARTEKVVTLFSQGINQSSSGSDKVNSIINCHFATGRIGKPGMGPFSLTGQPNAMGGREAGGMANTLAAHMDFAADDVARVQAFWQSPNIASKPGLKAVDMLQAVESGQIKVLWVMATNPLVSMPEVQRFHRALANCPMLIVSDITAQTDTAELAQVLLPATAWGERDGTVTNSERRISRQRPFLTAPGLARHDWWIISQVAQKLGAAGFDYQSSSEIFRELAQLSGLDNQGQRDYDLSALSALDQAGYDALQPVQWPVNAEYPQGRARFFDGSRFFTPSGKGQLLPIRPQLPQGEINSDYPFQLNTGRLRDQWHTMSRTGKSARLSQHIDQPLLSIHPTDAQALNLAEGELARVSSRFGSLLLKVSLTDSQTPGSLFAPIHWNSQNSSAGSIGQLVNAVLDPFSGQPELKHTPVRVSKAAMHWYGYLLTRRLPEQLPDYWVRVRQNGFWRIELAHTGYIDNWQALSRLLLPHDDQADWLQYQDPRSGTYRGVLLDQGKLDGVLYIGAKPELPGRDWLVSLFAGQELDLPSRMALVAGRPPGKQVDCGKIVCSCFQVGQKTLEAAMAQGMNLEQLQQTLKAGTNCGSCVPEIKALLAKRG